MITKANEQAEKNVIKTNQDFHNLMETRKRNAEERIKQLKNQALKDIKNASVKIAIESVEKLYKNSIYKSKLHKYIPGGAHTYSRCEDTLPSNIPSVLKKEKGAKLS